MKRKHPDEFDEFLAEQMKNPKVAAAFVEEKEKLDLAIKLVRLRQAAGLSQKDLAERIGTSQSVIARMENPEYTGHSIRMLRRFATALGARLFIDFEPIDWKTRSSQRVARQPSLVPSRPTADPEASGSTKY